MAQKNKVKVTPVPSTPDSLSLQIGSQYLCHTAFNAPNMPDVLRNFKAPLHLHLVVDSTLRLLSTEERAYEVRLSLQGFGLDHLPQPKEELQSFYQATVIYGGLFALKGNASEEVEKQFIMNEAPAFLYPSVRTLLLTTIREAGFSVGSLQPIDFRDFWKKNQ